MFSGIIQTVGTITHITHFKVRGDKRFAILASSLDLDTLTIGTSIAVNGVCLTILKTRAHVFWVDVSLHTASHTTLGAIKKGWIVNLEFPLRLNDFISGHLVTGHVDGIGKIVKIETKGRSKEIDIQIPTALCKYVSSKGSICINGVSLTVNKVAPPHLTVNIIPHTLTNTTFKCCKKGESVNIEVDILARYVESLLRAC